MKRKIPSRYRNAIKDYRWIAGSSIVDKWEFDTSGRVSDAGDKALEGAGTKRPFGISFVEVPLIPEDLAYGSSVADATVIWLTPLKNLIWFIQREITINKAA